MADESTSHQQTLMLRRVEAINGYAQVEQSLCRVFGHLLGAGLDPAAIVFYSITSAHARNRIIDELLKLRYGDRYEAYWNGIPNTPYRKGLFAIIRQLDQSRNEIVHWHFSYTLPPPGEQPEIGLAKPQAWPLIAAGTRIISKEQLIEFSQKADFVHRSLNMFWLLVTGGLPTDAQQPWQDIFQQPASYPPPDSHRLSLNYKAPENPPQPSQG